MEIKKISLFNFRNYVEEEIEFQNGVNVLIGSNGQGKTNILEGINYLITGKSYRVRNESELIFLGAKNFYLQALCQVKERLLRLEAYYEPGKKIMKLNQLPCKRLSDYVGAVNAVFFSPDDLNIIKGGPSERRRFLDHLLAQIKPGHIYLLNRYLKIIKQKNTLLKKEKNIEVLKNQIYIWNQQLIEIGSKIILNRALLTESLNKFCRPIFKEIFSADYNLDLTYLSLGRKDFNDALRLFPEVLENQLPKEIERKAVIAGPHRDDLQITINGRLANSFASQGQLRAIVLSLKLAEMEIILKEKDEYPILLLDDVLSELDKQRQKFLLKYIDSQKQTIITVTGIKENVFVKEKAVYRVVDGNIRREK